MQNVDADDMGDPVQASASETLPIDRPGRTRSCTEQARFVAGYFGWTMLGDAIRGSRRTVSASIEDLACVMSELGWIGDTGILWERMPFDEDDAVEALRAVQLARGWDF